MLLIGCEQTEYVKKYYENGKLSTKGHCKDDKLEGPLKIYYENGKLKAEAIFKNGELVSEKCWDIDSNEIEC